MTHPVVKQLRFTRNKWRLGLNGVPAEDAIKRVNSMNSISWFVGHLASHEHLYWCMWAQDENVFPELARYGWGQPATTPPLNEVLDMWEQVIQRSENYLNTITQDVLEQPMMRDGQPVSREPLGTNFIRITYHYWFHLGEMQAVRQNLGHRDLSNFVGDISGGEYMPEDKS